MKKTKAKTKKKKPEPVIPVVEVKPTPPPKPLSEEQIKRRDIIRDKMAMMKYKDLQINCVIRGIDFDFMVSKDTNGLQTWLVINWDMPCIQERLEEFDGWREKKLEEIGKPGEPFVRLGYVGTTDPNTGEILDIKKPEKMMSKPKKRERDEETGIFKGTKKAYTCELTKAGKPLAEIIELVTAKFPEAKEKSIKIWSKRFQKTLKK